MFLGPVSVADVGCSDLQRRRPVGKILQLANTGQHQHQPRGRRDLPCGDAVQHEPSETVGDGISRGEQQTTATATKTFDWYVSQF